MKSKTTIPELEQKIRSALSEEFGIDPALIVSEARMKDLGLDSMHIVGILVDLETELGVKLTELGFPPNPTLAEVAQTIEKSLSSSA